MKSWLPLIPFPSSEDRIEKDESDFVIHAAVTAGKQGAVEGVILHFRIHACDETAFGRIRGLEKRSPERASIRVQGLWEETCFEGFFTRRGTEYVEFNGTADGRWNLFHFDDYRKGMADVIVSAGHEPALIEVNKTHRGMELTWFISLIALPRIDSETRVGLTMVLETDTGKSYWAIAHLGDEADFHKTASFQGKIAVSPTTRR